MKWIILILLLLFCALVSNAGNLTPREIQQAVLNAASRYNKYHHIWREDVERTFVAMPLPNNNLLVTMTRDVSDPIGKDQITDKSQPHYLLLIKYIPGKLLGRVENDAFPYIQKASSGLFTQKGILDGEFVYEYTREDIESFGYKKNCIAWRGKIPVMSDDGNDVVEVQKIIAKIEEFVNFRMGDDMMGLYHPLAEKFATPTRKWVEDHKQIVEAHLFVKKIDYCMFRLSNEGIIQFNNSDKSLNIWYILNRPIMSTNIGAEEISTVYVSASYDASPAYQQTLRQRLDDIINEDGYVEWEIVNGDSGCRLKRIK